MSEACIKQRDLGFISSKVPLSQHIYINAEKDALESSPEAVIRRYVGLVSLSSISYSYLPGNVRYFLYLYKNWAYTA